jgi:hypothetical protein
MPASWWVVRQHEPMARRSPRDGHGNVLPAGHDPGRPLEQPFQDVRIIPDGLSMASTPHRVRVDRVSPAGRRPLAAGTYAAAGRSRVLDASDDSGAAGSTTLAACVLEAGELIG